MGICVAAIGSRQHEAAIASREDDAYRQSALRRLLLCFLKWHQQHPNFELLRRGAAIGSGAKMHLFYCPSPLRRLWP